MSIVQLIVPNKCQFSSFDKCPLVMQNVSLREGCVEGIQEGAVLLFYRYKRVSK